MTGDERLSIDRDQLQHAYRLARLRVLQVATTRLELDNVRRQAEQAGDAATAADLDQLAAALRDESGTARRAVRRLRAELRELCPDDVLL